MVRCIAVFLGLVSLTLSGCATKQSEPYSFIAIIASDAEKSAEWYKDVFNLTQVNRSETNAFTIILLTGAETMVELIEQRPPAPENHDREQGLFKAGFLISDFDNKVETWRTNGVTFLGRGKVIYDEALGYHSTILLDPDKNRIQVFGYSKSETESPQK